MIDRDLGSEWSPEEITAEQKEEIKEGKGLYLGLSSLSVFLLILFEFILWYLISPRLKEGGESFYSLAWISFILLGGLFSCNYLLVAISALTEKNFLFFEIRNRTFIYLFNSLVRESGRLLGISKDRIAHSFVKVNNALVVAKKFKLKGNRLLILLPRCLQHSDCKQMVIQNIKNCKECGKCSLADLRKLHLRYSFHISVATGGSLARKIIKGLKPSLILAVACERELVTGIYDTIKIPIIGIINNRPQGPCKNTRVDIETLENTLEFFIRQGITIQEEKPRSFSPSPSSADFK